MDSIILNGEKYFTKDIIRIKASRAYCYIYHKDEEILMGWPMSRYNSLGLIKINKSELINKAHIKHIEGRKITMSDGHQTTIATRKDINI